MRYSQPISRAGQEPFQSLVVVGMDIGKAAGLPGLMESDE